jgi:NADH:ubiquinone oxidoreductase subunit 6 (subunit J)
MSPLYTFARILRSISLAMLFGGSTAIVFAAITLIAAAKAHGTAPLEAAATNAPVFIEYSKVAAIFAITLVISEAIEIKGDLHNLEGRNHKWRMGRYFASIACAICTFIFSFAVVPQMSQAMTQMKTNDSAQKEFDRMHKISRILFSGTIAFALVSLVIPALGGRKVTD